MRSFYYGRPGIQRLQEKKLARLLQFAYGYVPYYRRVFRSMGKTPEDFRSASDLRRFPFLTKADVIGNYPDGLVARRGDIAVVRRGSGTTGIPASVAHSQASIDVRHALRLRYLTLIGFKPWSRIATLWVPEAYWRREPDMQGQLRPTTTILGYPVWVLGRPWPTLRIIRSIPGDARMEARMLYDAKPDFINGRPTQLRRVGAGLRDLGLEIAPKGLLTATEVQTRTCTSELERTFSCKVFPIYGTSEIGEIAFSCRERSGLHICEDFLIVEVLRGNEEVGEGEVGEIVVTHLYNYQMPLVRYRTGDFVRLGGQVKCGCGSVMRRIESVQGREKDWFITQQGGRIWGPDMADKVESELGLTDFQLVQESLGEVTARLMAKDLGRADLAPRLQLLLGKTFGRPIKVKLELREEEEFWRKSRPVTTLLAVGS
jgi:phenylacetate-CoA ligase